MRKQNDGRTLSRRTWLAGGLAAVAAPMLGACGGGETAEEEMSLLLKASGPTASDFTGTYNYGGAGNSRHVLDLYRAASATVQSPGPVYLWAHPNGTTYRGNVPSDSNRRQLREQGVSIISWESHATLTQDNEDEVTADAYLMLQWVRSVGPSLGLDPNRIVLGGSSRGTFASWKIGHDPAHASFIKGMFMKQALPGSVDETRCGAVQPNTISGKAPREWVTAQSPLIKFVHQPANINGACSPTNDRFHSEYNSRPVMDAYAALGISSRASRVINAPNVAAMDDYLLEFVIASLSASPPPPPTINFSDDFNGGFDSDRYTRSGSWDVANGALWQTSSSSYGYCAAGESGWANYTVTAVLMSLNPLSGTDNSQVSRVVARFVDGNNFYEAFVSKSGVLTIQSKKAGVVRTLQSVPLTGVNVGNWNRLALTCNGNSLTAALNGVPQATVTASDHSAGKAGVRSFACETRVDSLSIIGV